MDEFNSIPVRSFYGNSSSDEDFDSDDSLADPNYSANESDLESNVDNSELLYQNVLDIENNSDSDQDNDEDSIDPAVLAPTEAYNQWKVINPRCPVPHQQFDQTFDEGIQFVSLRESELPIKFFELFITEDVIDNIVNQTNMYAAQVLVSKTISRHSRLNQWKNTDSNEMKKFFGLLLWMGLVRYPKLSDYWSTRIIYKNNVASKTMSRNRFEIMLTMWHFANNEEAHGDRLHKITSLKNKLESLFQHHKIPGEFLCVDETMVPFRGRLLFRQYIPGKRHKYGVKLFKICDTAGYTYGIQVYEGKSDKMLKSDSLSTNVVLKLGEKYLGQGLKWKDKRDVLMLSTKHTIEITSTGKQNRKKEDIRKPTIVQDYNAGKAGIDLSDQLSSYSSVVRKSVKWYHKVAMELIFGTSVINARIIYNTICKKKISVTSFKESLVESLLELTDKRENVNFTTTKHKLEVIEEVDHRNRKIRKRCGPCYAKNREEKGSREADKASVTPRVTTYCGHCPEKPAMCSNCFVKIHLIRTVSLVVYYE
ncbi:hypothetical protein PPYR_02328 [Photinus pyralis]|uniref:PiggyBac transposable element-derived protein domain-containing protein n=1 Tax=Photinus pyralis TaxID=7054 RepID=A0A5N4B723_PHOPY|nr:hypothetical protein PPYR_02328 [Photinus pyralis]